MKHSTSGLGRVSFRRVSYLLTNCLGIYSVATLSWALIAWRDAFRMEGQHQLMHWFDQSARGGFDLESRIFFSAYAVIICGLAKWGVSYIEENGFYLYREEACVLYAACLVLVAITAVYSGFIGVHFLLAPQLGRSAPSALGVILGFYYFFRLTSLHELPSRGYTKSVRDEQLNPRFKAGLIFLSVAIWVAVYEMADLAGLNRMGSLLPVLLGGLTACGFIFAMVKMMAWKPTFWKGRHSHRPARTQPRRRTAPAIVNIQVAGPEFGPESSFAEKMR